MSNEIDVLVVRIVGFTWMFFMFTPLWICLILGISAHFVPRSKENKE